MMIDTHAHLEDYENVEEIVSHMKDGIIIISGVNQKTNEFVLSMTEQYKNVYGTIGIHPDEVSNVTEEDLAFVEKNLTHPKIVGIGEIGLDYYHSKEKKEEQKELFKKQIDLAKKYNKTIVIHSRDAIEDTYTIIKEKNLRNHKIVMHCYSGSKEMAQKFLEFNIKFGIGGVVTFENAKVLKDVVQNIGIENFLLETDSPYLTPEPYRGKKNEPFNIIFVAKKIAEIKEISLESVLKVTSENAICQFDLPL